MTEVHRAVTAEGRGGGLVPDGELRPYVGPRAIRLDVARRRSVLSHECADSACVTDNDLPCFGGGLDALAAGAGRLGSEIDVVRPGRALDEDPVDMTGGVRLRRLRRACQSGHTAREGEQAAQQQNAKKKHLLHVVHLFTLEVRSFIAPYAITVPMP